MPDQAPCRFGAAIGGSNQKVHAVTGRKGRLESSQTRVRLPSFVVFFLPVATPVPSLRIVHRVRLDSQTHTWSASRRSGGATGSISKTLRIEAEGGRARNAMSMSDIAKHARRLIAEGTSRLASASVRPSTICYVSIGHGVVRS
eukprot:2736410-Rhodomonas_salina.2